MNLVGEVGKTRLAIENGKLWPKDVSNGNAESVEKSLTTA